MFDRIYIIAILVTILMRKQMKQVILITLALLLAKLKNGASKFQERVGLMAGSNP